MCMIYLVGSVMRKLKDKRGVLAVRNIGTLVNP